MNSFKFLEIINHHRSNMFEQVLRKTRLPLIKRDVFWSRYLKLNEMVQFTFPPILCCVNQEIASKDFFYSLVKTREVNIEAVQPLVADPNDLALNSLEEVLFMKEFPTGFSNFYIIYDDEIRELFQKPTQNTYSQKFISGLCQDGHLELVQWFVENMNMLPTSEGMDWAFSNYQLQICQYGAVTLGVFPTLKNIEQTLDKYNSKYLNFWYNKYKKFIV
ncbi:MAG: hypothetical protein JKX76_01775 [Colwellia sp.]|nr:hypothetical protein [Colwellia sp.]